MNRLIFSSIVVAIVVSCSNYERVLPEEVDNINSKTWTIKSEPKTIDADWEMKSDPKIKMQ